MFRPLFLTELADTVQFLVALTVPAKVSVPTATPPTAATATTPAHGAISTTVAKLDITLANGDKVRNGAVRENMMHVRPMDWILVLFTLIEEYLTAGIGFLYSGLPFGQCIRTDIPYPVFPACRTIW